MLHALDLSNVLFLDIECASAQPSYDQLEPDMQELWAHKARRIARKQADDMEEDEAATLYTDRAAIFAEFGKVICISVGIVVRSKEGKLSLRLKSFADKDERKVLEDFNKLVNQFYFDSNRHYFCGHNIKEFDIPYLCRRMVVNQLPLQPTLNLAGKKPWETKHLLDTMELWKFGDYKHYTSLKLLAALLGFPSPKEDIDGSEVGRVFWEEGDLPRIARYCEKDVLAVVQLLMRYLRLPLFEEDQIVFVEEGS